MASTSSCVSLVSRRSRTSTPENGLKENFYHGSLGREEAEQVLKVSGFTEGLFLVRQSTTAKGDFVLSVVHQETVIHYQIQRNGEDALFSLSSEKKVIHGLDQMIQYYLTEPRSGLQHRLTDWVPASLAPPETRLHGTENLLHRACTEGNSVVVTELLSMGYRNLAARNHEGQTALHLASYHGRPAVVAELVKYGARVHCSDSAQDTPLHLAAQANRLDCLKVLLEEGGGNPTVRNQATGWVALHEAAARGHLDCVELLLLHGGPTKPRANLPRRNETPADLARAAGHHDVAAFLDKYPAPYPERDITEWYHPNIDRKTALSLLNTEGARDGTFLIRNSSKKKRFYVLSMLWQKKGHHFEIEKQGIYFFIDEGPYMTSLDQLVHHYARFPDGLPCPLSFPVAPEEVSSSLSLSTASWDPVKLPPPTHTNPFLPCRTSPLLPPPPVPAKVPNQQPTTPMTEFATSRMFGDMATLRMDDKVHSQTPPHQAPQPSVPPRVPTRGRPLANPPTNLRPIDQVRAVYINNETLRRVRHSKDNIPLESIKLTHIIGEGEFGSVYKGSYMTEQGVQKDVAIKALSDSAVDIAQSEEFMGEARVMMGLDHQCVVQLLGTSHGPPILMVMELVPLGSMLSYLEQQPESVSTEYELPLWASQISCGMQYLQTKRFVHRDLAARNILLASKYQTKISDFGLSRVVGEKDYYRATKGGRWPVKWYAPECINYGTFSHASDVWSYGVVLWEMFSYGDQPFKDKTGQQTVDYIEAGHRLPMPPKASNDCYSIMLKCWEYKPENRPTFEELFKTFSDNPEYLNLTELLKTQDLQQLGMG